MAERKFFGRLFGQKLRNSVADAGLIIASIDPCFSCMDR